MSAMGKLAGVECAECRRKGHRCQAQMVQEQLSAVSGRRSVEPVCLRCADGEPCCFETAAKLPTPERLVDEVDVFAIPALSREDGEFARAARRQFAAAEESIKKAALADLGSMSVKDVAEKYGLGIKTVNGLKTAMTRDRQLAGGYPGDWVGQRLSRRVNPAMVAVEMQIGGETVVMAPMASMGAEMLRDSYQRSAISGQRSEARMGRPKKMIPCSECGQMFGVTEMRDHRREAHLRSYRRIAVEIG